MNKVTLMQLVDETSSHKTISEFIRSRRKLSIAIDAALKQARTDALEEAAKVCKQVRNSWSIEKAQFAVDDCALEISKLKETK